MLGTFVALMSICAWAGAGVGETVAHLAHRDAGVEAVQRAISTLDPTGSSLEIVAAADHVAQASLLRPSDPSRNEVVDLALNRGWAWVDADSSVSIVRRGAIQADVWEDRIEVWSPPRRLAAGSLLGAVVGVAGAAALARRRIGLPGLLLGVAAVPFAGSALLQARAASTPTFAGMYGPLDMLVDRSPFILLTWAALLAAAHLLGADVISAARRTQERLDVL